MSRETLRGMAEWLLVVSGAPALARRLRPGALVLAYHNVVPDAVGPLGDRSLHLPFTSFVRQIEQLRSTHEIVGLDLIGYPTPGERPRAAITFDDAYTGALELALPHLAEVDLPVTLFVAPGMLGAAQTWWDALAAPATGLDPAVRRHALGPLRGEHAAIMAWARAEQRPLRPATVHEGIATLDRVRAAASRPGVSIGMHTWGHPNLAALEESEVTTELERCRAWFADHLPDARPWLAYPYGAYSHATLRAVRRCGITTAFRVEGGLITASHREPLAVPRLNVPAGVTDRGFRLRASGVLHA